MSTLSSLFAGLDATSVELFFRVLLQGLLLLAASLFTGSETALFSLSSLDLEKLRNTRNPFSERIHAMLDEPRRLIISILCGSELLAIASTANMAAILVMAFGEENAGWVNIVIMVPLLLLFSEVTPKTFAVTFPVRFSTAVSARILPRWITLIAPLREVIRFVSDRITTFIVGEAVKEENILYADEFRTLVEEGAATGVIDATERVLIDNMLAASETPITHIMTSRPRINFLDVTTPLPQVVRFVRRVRHPRVPVIKKYKDHVLGFLHSEDLLRLSRSNANINQVRLRQLLRPAHFVPPTKKVDEMFDYFQQHNTRAAIVISEDGGVSGIVTMKDVLSFIFGEITGTRRRTLRQYKDHGGNRWTVSGDMHLEFFNELVHASFEETRMVTVGGYLFFLFDRLPKEGESLVHEGFHFNVAALDGLRICKIRVRRMDFDQAQHNAEGTDSELAWDDDGPEWEWSEVQVIRKKKKKKKKLPVGAAASALSVPGVHARVGAALGDEGQSMAGMEAGAVCPVYPDDEAFIESDDEGYEGPVKELVLGNGESGEDSPSLVAVWDAEENRRHEAQVREELATLEEEHRRHEAQFREEPPEEETAPTLPPAGPASPGGSANITGDGEPPLS
ncbi:MAG: hemolysin family protein [Magnetococcus sp. WYHC-3]